MNRTIGMPLKYRKGARRQDRKQVSYRVEHANGQVTILTGHVGQLRSLRKAYRFATVSQS